MTNTNLVRAGCFLYFLMWLIATNGEITIESTGYGHKSPELAIAKIHKLKTTQYRPQGEMA